MARSPRIEYSGAIYHVIQRGNNREYIFREEDYKGFLMNRLKKIKEQMPFNLFAYVLMDNHYHMLLQTIDTPLSTIMHRLNASYGRYYNRNEKRSGPAFEKRYYSILVQNKSYLLTLARYIHYNPVKAGMCAHISDYKWSSDVFYRRNMKNIVDIGFLLGMLSSDRIRAIREYIEFMDRMDQGGEGQAELEKKLERTLSVGDEDFRAKIENNPIINAPSLDEILKSVCESEGVFELLKRGSRKRVLTPYKIEYIKRARKHGYSYADIGKSIGVSDNAIISSIQRSGMDII